MTYILRRQSSDRILEQEFKRKRDCQVYASYAIHDNGHGTKKEAQEFAATLLIDTPATFGPYTFTITRTP